MGGAMADCGVAMPSSADVLDQRAQLGGWSVTNYGHASHINPLPSLVLEFPESKRPSAAWERQ